jgi:hypothetical protein
MVSGCDVQDLGLISLVKIYGIWPQSFADLFFFSIFLRYYQRNY